MKPQASSLFDRVRAWALGLLAPAEIDALRRDLEHDRMAADFAEDYRDVHAVTSALRDDAATSRLEFSAIQARIDAEEHARRSLRWRKVAAAAAVLVVGGAALWRFAPSAHSNEPLRLTAIPLQVAKAEAAPVDLPAYLASYQPTRDGQIQWLDDLDEGLRVARASDRPVFVFGMFPTCPLCIHMQKTGLRDEGVLALVDQDFVPVRIDFSHWSEEDINAVFESGYPRFEVRGADGELVHTFPGVHEAPSFLENLSQGLDAALAKREPPTWDNVRRVARGYEEARSAEAQGREGEAYRGFAAVAHDPIAGELPRAGQGGVERVASAARDTLLSAREVAARDAAEAERELASAARRFEGSPYAADLEAARERLARDGRFPPLASDE